jgi:hypothetical protein
MNGLTSFLALLTETLALLGWQLLPVLAHLLPHLPSFVRRQLCLCVTCHTAKDSKNKDQA